MHNGVGIMGSALHLIYKEKVSRCVGASAAYSQIDPWLLDIDRPLVPSASHPLH